MLSSPRKLFKRKKNRFREQIVRSTAVIMAPAMQGVHAFTKEAFPKEWTAQEQARMQIQLATMRNDLAKKKVELRMFEMKLRKINEELDTTNNEVTFLLQRMDRMFLEGERKETKIMVQARDMNILRKQHNQSMDNVEDLKDNIRQIRTIIAHLHCDHCAELFKKAANGERGCSVCFPPNYQTDYRFPVASGEQADAEDSD